MGIKDAQEIKGLQSRLSKEEAHLRRLKEEQAQISRDIRQSQAKIQGFNQRISEIEKSSKELVVSEHALLRYLERVKGIDLNAIRAEILTPNVHAMVSTLGDNGVYPSNGFKLRVKNKTVVTIIESDGGNKASGQ